VGHLPFSGQMRAAVARSGRVPTASPQCPDHENWPSLQPSSTPPPAARSAPASRQATPLQQHSYRLAGLAGIVAVVTWIAGTLLATRPDLTTQSALRSFLDDSGSRLFISWLVMSAFAIAWLVFVVGVKAVVKAGPGGDLFTAAAVLGVGLMWTGASVETAAAAPGAHTLPLSVYNALGEAAHLTTAAGIAATGLALVALARTTPTRAWPKAFTRGSLLAGIVLLLTGVIGPLALPVLALLMTTATVLSLRRARSGVTAIEPPEPEE
jgi:hypothetical protein